MLQMQENFEKERNEDRKLIQSLSQKVDELLRDKQTQVAVTSAPPASATPPRTPKKQNCKPNSRANWARQRTSVSALPTRAWSPAEPITVARAGSAYMNISFDALMDVGGSTQADPSSQLELGDHDPIKNGFSLRNAEIAVDGAVDPYLKGFGNIVLKLDKNNEHRNRTGGSVCANDGAAGKSAGESRPIFRRVRPPERAASASMGVCGCAHHPGTRVRAGRFAEHRGARFVAVADAVLHGAEPGNPGRAGRHVLQFSESRRAEFGGRDRFHGRPTIDRTLRGPQDLVFVPRLASSFDLTRRADVGGRRVRRVRAERHRRRASARRFTARIFIGNGKRRMPAKGFRLFRGRRKGCTSVTERVRIRRR